MTMIIAEIGLNHNGKLVIAKELVRSAIWAGADAVKFQTFWNIGRLKKYEFSREEWINLKQFCDDLDITFLSSPHSIEAIDFLEELVPMYKIASPYLTNEEFIKKVASTGKPILLSTGSLSNSNGMATDDEIEKALSYIKTNEIVLMHCVSKYPCTDPHYERIDELRKHCMRVGLSDHSTNINIPKDIDVLEKHFMLENQKCIDENVSLKPEQFREMVDLL